MHFCFPLSVSTIATRDNNLGVLSLIRLLRILYKENLHKKINTNMII